LTLEVASALGYNRLVMEGSILNQAGGLVRETRRIFWQSLGAFWRDGCLELAAALSFWMLLAIIPIIFLFLWAFGLVLGSFPELYHQLDLFVTQSMPQYAAFIIGEVKKIKLEADWAGVWGFLFMFWISSFMFDSLDFSLSHIFKADKHRNFFHAKLISFGLIPLTGLMVLLSAGISTGVEFLARLMDTLAVVRAAGSWTLGTWLDGGWFVSLPTAPWMTFGRTLVYGVLLKYLFPFVIICLSLTGIYKLIPYTRVPWRSALYGGFFGAVFWEIAKNVFANITTHNPAYSYIYGSMTTFILFLILMFFFSCVVLYCGELAAHHRNLRLAAVASDEGV
jgi:uncharacterized BrkB/YihY/UPF0761 family membrane protein